MQCFLTEMRADQVDPVGTKAIHAPGQYFPGPRRIVDGIAKKPESGLFHRPCQQRRQVFVVGIE
ncbi:hypothetical protein D3C81_2091340 [compost metagenome]